MIRNSGFIPKLSVGMSFNRMRVILPARANKGNIILEINVNVPPYFFYWEGPGVDDNNRNDQNLTSLRSEEYTV